MTAARSCLGPLVHREPERAMGGGGGIMSKVSVLRVFGGHGEGGKGQTGGLVRTHVLTFPLMCWYLGRHGSSGKGS